MEQLRPHHQVFVTENLGIASLLQFSDQVATQKSFPTGNCYAFVLHVEFLFVFRLHRCDRAYCISGVSNLDLTTQSQISLSAIAAAAACQIEIWHS
jgi:hypothetical protein